MSDEVLLFQSWVVARLPRDGEKEKKKRETFLVGFSESFM
jgi:hypothetical protein